MMQHIGMITKIVAKEAKEVGKTGNDTVPKIPEFAKASSFTPECPLSVKDGASKIPDFTSRELIPRTGGEWQGEPGNSKWTPDGEGIPSKQNPDGKKWGEILDEYNIDGIDFKDNYPDFEGIAEESVEIDNFSKDRFSNFSQADKKTAEGWNAEGKDGKTWTAEDVRNYRKENNLTWHEHEDMKTLQLVPSEVHGNIPHSGGVAAKKNDT